MPAPGELFIARPVGRDAWAVGWGIEWFPCYMVAYDMRRQNARVVGQAGFVWPRFKDQAEAVNVYFYNVRCERPSADVEALWCLGGGRAP